MLSFGETSPDLYEMFPTYIIYLSWVVCLEQRTAVDTEVNKIDYLFCNKEKNNDFQYN